MTIVPIERINVQAFTIPTDAPEADGTFEWKSTSIVIVEVFAAGIAGLGYSYADPSTAALIQNHLGKIVLGKDALAINHTWLSLIREVRNMGRPGIASHAISAIDNALWDLKSKLLDLPLATLLGKVRDQIPIYGSGGFTSYSIDQLQRQLNGWTDLGIRRVKMKVGTNPSEDPARVAAARDAIGDAELFVDANGAYSRKEALRLAEVFEKSDVRWFEEPVSSDDLEGLRLLRDESPKSMMIAAGEYGYDLPYFYRMIHAGAVDVLQADATRCLGVTGFMKAASLCEAALLPLSAHTSPTLHAHLCCAAPSACHVEYFHDHVRIEELLFEGSLVPKNGFLIPDDARPGLGISLRKSEARRYAA